MTEDASFSRNFADQRGGMTKKLVILFCVLISGTLALSTVPAHAQQQSETIVLTGGMLISGLSVPPLHHATIVIRGNQIVQVGRAAEIAIPPGATVIDTSGQTMMPGLIDAHAHLFMMGYISESHWFEWIESSKYSIEQIMELSAYQLLMSGVTAAIDLGGTAKDSVSLRDRINSGDVPGPRLQVSGPLVTRRAFGGFPADASAVLTSPKEGAEIVDRLHRMGVDVIKAHSRLTRDDYFAIVERAHSHNMKVHAHVYSEADIRNAFEAGADVLQHVGSAGYPAYSPELVREIAEAGRPVVITAAHRSWIYPDTVAFPERLQDQELKKLFPQDIWDVFQESFKDWPSEGYFTGIYRQMKFRSESTSQWIDAGALMGVGTDSGTPMNFNTDGLFREMKVLVDEGLPIMEAIANTTRVNARIMGNRNLGTIEPGKLADIIVVPGDPIYNELTNLAYIKVVIKDGVVYKKDGQPTVPMPL